MSLSNRRVTKIGYLQIQECVPSSAYPLFVFELLTSQASTKPLNFGESDNLLKNLVAFLEAKLVFKAWQCTLTFVVSAVFVHLIHFVCPRWKFAVWWLSVSKCSAVSCASCFLLSSTSYLCVKPKFVLQQVSLCCTSARDHN